MLARMLRCRLQYFIFRLDDQVKVFILLWKRRSSTKERQLQDFLVLCKVSKPKIVQFSLDDLPPFESYWYQVYLDHLWYAGIRKQMPSRCVVHAIILFSLSRFSTANGTSLHPKWHWLPPTLPVLHGGVVRDNFYSPFASESKIIYLSSASPCNSLLTFITRYLHLLGPKAECPCRMPCLSLRNLTAL